MKLLIGGSPCTHCEADVDIHRQMKLDRLKDRLNKVRDPEARLE